MGWRFYPISDVIGVIYSYRLTTGKVISTLINLIINEFDMKKVTATVLKTWSSRDKITAITAYVSFFRIIWWARNDVILIGDSLGMVLQGHEDTLPVSIDDMAYHTRCQSGC